MSEGSSTPRGAGLPAAAGAHAVVQARGLHKAYPEAGRQHAVLVGVDAQFAAAESVALLGRSGSGKSTLLNLLSGIDLPDRGEVYLQGEPITAMDDARRTRLRRQRMGFVFQFFNLLPTLSVVDNVALPQVLNGVAAAAARREARALLQRVGLAGREDTYADRLSGGEQQRVALARAIVHDPVLVLADEPTGNLDAETGRHILQLLLGLVADRGVTLIMATHSGEAAAACDRIVRLDAGRIEGVTAPGGAEPDGPP